MLADERARRQCELEKCIYEMSLKMMGTKEEIRKISLKLLEIYGDDFRHNYSGFFPVILEVSKDDNDYNLDFLSENIEALRVYIEDDYVKGAKEFEKLYRHIDKLCDHINLEIGRLNYYSINDNRIKDIESKTEAINNELIEATKQLKKATKKASSMQTELIAVLGIFAAIILSFTGGFAFTSSVLENFHNGNIYRWLVIILLVGLVLINILYGLFFFIERIVYQKNPQNLKPLIIIDSILVALMLLVGVGWGFGVVEKVQQKNVNIFYPDNSQIEYSVSQNTINSTESNN